ncbi:MAG TPA: LemA family protein [Clostridiales bacterium]|nr:LemA family protein [Clostridiales bacterium]HQH62700.1 LemA family protein [Clostridiales bacterium]HQK73065.1 LemA family protein [Clostridiales bacterium]
MLLWVFLGLVGLVLLIGLWLAATYNGFVKLRNKVEEAFSTMDVFLKKRYDLIPNIVETVKGYAAHESETLRNVVAARNAAAGAQTIEDRVTAENAFQATLKSLFALSEAYPDLKANTNFLNLQSQLTAMEGEISDARRYYNAVVKAFNTKTEVFPSNIIAGIFHFVRKPLFEVSQEAERQNVEVKF